MENFWKFKNVAKTDTEAEHAELRIEGEIIADDDVWLYELFDIEHVAKNKFKEELAKLDNQPITVWINSPGGSVWAATSIYNALMEHKGAVTVKIDSMAMSAASVIAMAGGEIQMSPMSIMMVHNPLIFSTGGDMHDLRHTADVLDTVKESIMNAYQIKTGATREKLSELMDAETFMSAKTAVDKGFADSVMYMDSEEPIKNFVANLSFNRLAIQNSAIVSQKALDEFRNKIEPQDDGTELAKAKLALELIS